LLVAWWSPRQSPVAPATATTMAAGAPAPAARPAPVPTLDEAGIAARLQAGADTAAVQQALLRSWQAPATLDLARCTPSIAPGLHCLRGQGQLDALVAIGRPLLLHLRGAEGERWALLLGADATEVRLQVGDDVFDVGRVLFAQQWDGQYLALYRAPDGIGSEAGMPASLREWLVARLGSAPEPATVRAFQASRGISADGVVGPETMMALAAAGDGPRLLRVLD